jgi:hypothetical protein
MQKSCSQILNSNHTFMALESHLYGEVRNENWSRGNGGLGADKSKRS